MVVHHVDRLTMTSPPMPTSCQLKLLLAIFSWVFYDNKNLNAKEEIHVPCQASLAASDLSKIRLRGRYTGLYAGMQRFGGSTIPGEFTVSYKTLGYLHQLLDDSFAQNLQEMRNMSVINLVPLTTARLIIRKDRRTNLGSKVGPN